jgi:hypothetical protein
MKNPLTFRSEDFLFCIAGIWEELAPASDGSHRYRHAKSVHVRADFCVKGKSAGGIWERRQCLRGSHRKLRTKAFAVPTDTAIFFYSVIVI